MRLAQQGSDGSACGTSLRCLTIALDDGREGLSRTVLPARSVRLRTVARGNQGKGDATAMNAVAFYRSSGWKQLSAYHTRQELDAAGQLRSPRSSCHAPPAALEFRSPRCLGVESF